MGIEEEPTKKPVDVYRAIRQFERWLPHAGLDRAEYDNPPVFFPPDFSQGGRLVAVTTFYPDIQKVEIKRVYQPVNPKENPPQ